MGIFVYFVIQSNNAHQASVQANHEEWRGWLARENKTMRDWMTGQNKIWRAWVDERDKSHVATMQQMAESRGQRDRELIGIIEHLDEQIERLTELITSQKTDG